MTYDPHETRGVALTAFAVAQATLVTLNSKKIISDAEADQLLEVALTAIETSFPAEEKGAQSARKLAETLAAAVRRGFQVRER